MGQQINLQYHLQIVQKDGHLLEHQQQVLGFLQQDSKLTNQVQLLVEYCQVSHNLTMEL